MQVPGPLGASEHLARPAAKKGRLPPPFTSTALSRVHGSVGSRSCGGASNGDAPPLTLVTDRSETAAQPSSDVGKPSLETSADLPHVTYPRPVDPALAGLEEFLSAIIRARTERAAAR